MFIIEGNIGSGKSTLLSKLENNYNLNVVQEPVDIWTRTTNINEQSILELFYNDPGKYAFAFQMHILLTRLKTMQNINNQYAILERSILTDKNVFMNILERNGFISTIQSKVFEEWFDHCKHVCNGIKGIIYLRSDPFECMQRIQKRNRISENNISIEYLIDLHNQHDAWLLNNTEYNVIVIDGNDDYHLNKIMQFLHMS